MILTAVPRILKMGRPTRAAMRTAAMLILGAVPIFGLAQFGSSSLSATPAAGESDEQAILVSFSPFTFDAPTATKMSLQQSTTEVEYAARREVGSNNDGAVILGDWRFTGDPKNDHKKKGHSPHK